jgi:arylformamidase
VIFFDVTRPLSPSTLVLPGDCIPSFIQEDRGNYLINELQMSTHSGTHIDAPVHFLKRGETIDEVPLENLIGPCRVLDLTSAGKRITQESLKGQTGEAERLLLKTTFSGRETFDEDYPCIDMSAARMLAASRIRCIGIDSPSIESYRCDGAVHRTLLESGCSIIELLDLSRVEEGDYGMIALPLRLAGLDGSPARVVLCPSEGERDGRSH